MNTSLRATYRIQFNKDYTLYDAVLLVPYLSRLGISHIYASPLLASVPGSMHGYDTISWDYIDPDRGGEVGLKILADALRKHNMGLILDIVPNHMSTSYQNLWWQDVLLNGHKSKYAGYFDIDWSVSQTQAQHRIILPFLEKPLCDILDEKKIRFLYHSGKRSFVITYEDRIFPIALESMNWVVGFSSFKDAENLPLDLRKLLIDFFSSATSEGRQNLLLLLQKQHYQLVWWRNAGDLVNWRRFFDVTSLIALRMERLEVFVRTHTYIFDLYQRGLIDGFRIDHIDGLLQPDKYCQHLRKELEKLKQKRPENLRNDPVIFVEKILANKETLSDKWLVSGTTGYDFLEQTSLLLHNPKGEKKLDVLWEQCGVLPYKKVQELARNEKLDSSFYKMFRDLILSFINIFPPEQDITEHAVETVLRKILVAFPVYRIYFLNSVISKQSLPYLRKSCNEVRQELPTYYIPLLNKIECILSQKIDQVLGKKGPEDLFVSLTAPLAAKAGEDTAFYRYARLLSRNEVGTDPDLFSKNIEAFHQANISRFLSHPDALLCTATHDHKRGEDGRARLMVLSEPEVKWPETVMHWFEQNADLHILDHSKKHVSQADEIFIYQTLISAWPLNKSDFSDFPHRLRSYLTKALRESGLSTSWDAPDITYEKTCQNFMMQLLCVPFVKNIATFINDISPAAAMNSLTQVILRCMVPGVPDLYQGREDWDFSLVDPDNRRPVNYLKLQENLEQEVDLLALVRSWRDGKIKQAIIYKFLGLRKKYPQIFTNGRYEKLLVEGPLSDHVVAFQRFTKYIKIIVIVTRFNFSLNINEYLQSYHDGWNETKIFLHEDLKNTEWKSILWGNTFKNNTLSNLAYFYGSVPFDVLISHHVT
ncbi:1,4-alpha-D-glucan 1-alpha-D-glucosylmutase [Acetobacter pasteurianus NBRC 101655]|uniref:malto-oligosyltrehalose synthase n=1 Tax=Acetobacter pasteurianus TaxID=438 RepID=UPI00024574F9|nr:malto-oligosyltrehalose synthase [Acetobacter pasteurianus]BAU39220.1 1,4-alpha-D-glucan 1-alpha-D-glucosylmutase [Acetobacter pasteurianus NBRC 101655]